MGCVTASYVIFQTFFDVSAGEHLLPPRGASQLPKKFPAEFRRALPSRFHYLLDWQHPAQDNGRHRGEFWGLSKQQLEAEAGCAAVVQQHAAFERSGQGQKLAKL